MRPLGAVVLAWTLALAGCAQPPESTPDVVASFYPLAYLAEKIGGANVSVGTIVPPGVEPHDYEPTPADFVRITDARLLLVLGAGFEGWIGTARAQAPDANLTVATDGLPLREGEHRHEGEADDAEEREEESGARDPHVWLDPILFRRMAENVENALSQEFPQHEAAFGARLVALKANLTALDATYERVLGSCETRAIITSHAAFGYVADRYNFTEIGITGLSPEAEADPETLAETIDAARRHNVTIVFFEELVSPRIAEAIAKEVGASTRVLSPIEGIAPDAAARGADYESVMRENLAALREAMRCA